MEKAAAREIGLFCFLVFLDERFAERAASQAITRFRKFSSGPGQTVPADSRVALAKTLISVFDKREFFRRALTRPEKVLGLYTVESLKMEFGPWRQFLKQASRDEILSVLLVQILGFSSLELALAEEVSEGTIDYRLSHGLKLLSQMTPLGVR
ncbi:MAG: hypothetical protein K2X47_12570 [Bdellovibrionales bacterium]|nr:hypothetical protein [Bdellovibrionales bacterium]